MDVLAGRKTGGYIEGDIRISGHPKVQETFARISGYCEQNDIHSPQVTIRESLIYSAWLRLSAEVDDESKMVSCRLETHSFLHRNAISSSHHCECRNGRSFHGVILGSLEFFIHVL